MIDLRCIGTLYREVGSSLKELHWLEHTGHLVMLDYEIEQVTALTLSFMDRCLAE